MFSGATIQPSSTVRDLGVILDTERLFGPHVDQLVRLSAVAFTSSAAYLFCQSSANGGRKTVVNGFVVSKID